ncbi:MAG: 1-acyl-sn-glycerol-3-phosphate acyltransferase [Geothrix sp.]|uniref:lysophospholipid acyltransferase family protein n=1 Tax=Geothrix sp. TaxID=1962974 RepID=UPI0017E76B56|nr:lysophospholipid acyltransferase family protein [Geothrix sp.]NWJ39647.1 1-acyl-sn-glycerol-3-phosphate acyltransferase [Geothrix sp.]WIL22333.1 MAG: 1-acyl-sn-glycerol-3-phosphate acyltransferase [Geothrix sp.]
MSWTGVLWPTFAILPHLAAGAEPQSGMHRWARRMVPALGVDLEVIGNPRSDIQLWVSNHLSWVDPVILMSLRPMGTIAKGEVAGYPFIGRWAQKSGIHFVEREDATSRAAALASFAASLHGGRDMLLFPEGTTTRGDRLAGFYEGGLRAAFDLGLPAQPLRISSPAPHYPWTGSETLLPHLRTLFGTRTRVTVAAEETLYPADFCDPTSWIAAFRSALAPRSSDVR